MGVSNSKNRPIVLARCKTPGYCIKTVGSRHVLLAGGGGSSKTGVANEIELMLLSYSTFSQDQEKRESRDISSPLIADRICSINTNPHATMNMDVACIAAPASGRYLIATGHDQYCDLYESTGFTLTDPAKKTGKLSLDFKKIARIVADRAASSPYQKVVRFDKSEAVTFENSRKMYTGGADGYIRIWNVESIRKTKEKDPQPMLEISAHHGDVNDLDISADAKTLLSVGHDAKTFLWDAITGCKIFEVEIPESLESRCRPRSVRFTTLGSENLTFVVSYNHIIRSPKSRSYLSLWICNREKNICKHVVLSEACGEAISAMAISECGIYTAIGTIGGSIGIYDTHEMKPLYFARETHSIFVTDIEFLSRHAVDFTPPNRSQLKNANTGVVSEHRAAVISLSADQTVQLHAIPYIRDIRSGNVVRSTRVIDCLESKLSIMDSLQTPRRALRDTKNVNATPFVTPKNRVMQLQNTPIFETGFQVFGGMMKGAGRSERHETAEEQFSRCEPDAGLERFAHEDTFEHLLRIEEDSDCVGKMAFRLLSDGQLSEKVFHELLTDDEMESLKSGKPLYQGDLDAVLKELGIE